MNEIIRKEKGSSFALLGKIVFCIVAFFLVIFTVLANMGGNGDVQKESLEQIASQATGYTARVKTLNNLTYFPTISADFEDMELLSDPAADYGIAHIDHARFAMTFWDIGWRTGRIKALDIQGITAQPGALLDKPVTVKSFAIIDANDSGANLKGEGSIGGAPFSLVLGMKAQGSGHDREYWFDSRRDFTAQLGDIKISAAMQNAGNPYLMLQDIKIAGAARDIATGEIDISKRRAREITLGGALKLPGGTELKPDLVYDAAARKLSGTISSETFRAADVAPGSAFDEFIKQLVSVFGDPQKNAKTLDDFFAAQDVTLDVKGDTAYHGRLKFENNSLVLK